jgi:protein tyrosine phosphatase (PTP) superfamily phosphohydrolase (DUF442 family)
LRAWRPLRPADQQPSRRRGDGPACGEEIEAAAQAAGLAYAAVPIAGLPGPGEIAAVRDAVAAADGPVLAFCRSGMRSIVAWAAAKPIRGARRTSCGGWAPTLVTTWALPCSVSWTVDPLRPRI